jgi:hypothetical protein
MAAFPKLQVNGIPIASFRFALGRFKQTKNPPSGLPAGSAVLLPESVALPTIVADAYSNADARRPEADASTRTVIPVTIGTALDISLARCVIV